MNPFEVLDVNEDDDDETIKKAYKREAQQNHPDKGGDPDKFLEIAEAYSCIKTIDDRVYYEKNGTTKKPVVDEVSGKIADLFGQIISADDMSGNIIHKAISIVDDAILNQQHIVSRCEDQNKVLGRQLGRVVSTSDSNLYEGVIIQRIEHNDAQIENMRSNISLMDKVLVGLNSYEDTCVEPQYESTQFNRY